MDNKIKEVKEVKKIKIAEMKDKLIKVKIVFDRGRYWVGYLTFLMMVFVTVTSMRQYAYFEFLSGRYWLAIVLISSIAFMLLLGYLELKRSDIYQREAEIYASINPIQKKVFENQERILEKLDELDEKLNLRKKNLE